MFQKIAQQSNFLTVIMLLFQSSKIIVKGYLTHQTHLILLYCLIIRIFGPFAPNLSQSLKFFFIRRHYEKIFMLKIFSYQKLFNKAVLIQQILMLFVALQSLSCVQLFAIPQAAERQAPLFSTVSWSLLRFMSIEPMMLSNHLTLCYPPLLLPSSFPSIRVFSNEFASGGHSIGTSPSATILSINNQS